MAYCIRQSIMYFVNNALLTGPSSQLRDKCALESKKKINQCSNENLIWHVNAKIKLFIPLNEAAAAVAPVGAAAVCLQVAARADADWNVQICMS